MIKKLINFFQKIKKNYHLKINIEIIILILKNLNLKLKKSNYKKLNSINPHKISMKVLIF